MKGGHSANIPSNVCLPPHSLFGIPLCLLACLALLHLLPQSLLIDLSIQGGRQQW